MKNGWPVKLTEWYRQNKRDLPWRNTRNPYAIWVSEIMLQQTRVESVKGYYQRFMQQFPTVRALAAAPEQDVLKAWEGLGYYSRARNLHKAAQEIVEHYGAELPHDLQTLKHLPGIGDYTAGAIASIAFGVPAPAVDGNVKRVASRLLGAREPIEAPETQKKLYDHLLQAVTESDPATFNQAMMELGATLCTPRAPQCDFCPLKDDCDAYLEGDAESLPVHEKKQPAKEIDMAVCLLTHRGKVLLFKRSERLLNGLYVFMLFEAEMDKHDVEARLREAGIQAVFRHDLGRATHVFTHRIWNMRIYQYELLSVPGEAWLAKNAAVWADAQTLNALPMPTAMKAAKKAALEWMEIKTARPE